jgi:hypothetical protein
LSSTDPFPNPPDPDRCFECCDIPQVRQQYVRPRRPQAIGLAIRTNTNEPPIEAARDLDIPDSVAYERYIRPSRFRRERPFGRQSEYGRTIGWIIWWGKEDVWRHLRRLELEPRWSAPPARRGRHVHSSALKGGDSIRGTSDCRESMRRSAIRLSQECDETIHDCADFLLVRRPASILPPHPVQDAGISDLWRG